MCKACSSCTGALRLQTERVQAKTAVQGAQEEIDPVAVSPAASPEVDAAPTAAPAATDLVAETPLEDEIPEDIALVPAATEEVPVEAPEEALVPAAVELDTAHAPGAVEVATVNVDGDLEDLLYTAPGTCPKNPIEYVPAGKHEAELTPPVTAIKTYGDKVGANGKFPLPYDTVQNGGAYCVSPASNNPMVTVGGTFLFEGKDGTCLPPPVTAAGSPCCTIYMWQPNADGFYYDNCSMKCGLQPFPLLY